MGTVSLLLHIPPKVLILIVRRLGWTIASEMAVGRNRNKIYAIAVASFWITVWVTVFTLPYLYYNAGLGCRTGFGYTALCFITPSYVYFCVGEVTGRTMEEIDGFFRQVR